MKCDRLGTTILDKVRLCYTAEPALIEVLNAINMGEVFDFDDFQLRRIDSKYYTDVFIVLDDNKRVGEFRFGHYGDLKSNYIWFSVENEVLYNDKVFRKVMKIPTKLNLVFNNFTSIELAKDFTKNIVSLIRKMFRDNSITTIVNGKAIRDRKLLIKEINMIYSTSLSKLRNPTINIKQAKAVANKSFGVTLCAYNKKTEIEEMSGKHYISDYYGNTKTLHRLELRLNNDEIKGYLHRNNILQSSDVLFNSEVLDDMYFYHLQSVLRFSRGRKPIKWSDILHW